HLLMVYNMATQEKEFASGGAGDKDIDGFVWLNDQKIIYDISTRKLWSLGLFGADVGSISSGYPLVQNYGSLIISIPLHDRLHPLVWNRVDTFHGDNKDLGVAVLNTANLGGVAVNLAATGVDKVQMDQARDNNVRHIDSTFPLPKPGIGTGYMTDKVGKLSFAYTSDNGRPSMFRLEGDNWVKCPVDIEHVRVYGAGTEPGQVLATAPLNGKPRPLQFLNTVTGEWGEALETEKAYDFNGWLYGDPVTRDVIGAFTNRED